jgi:hypothetical protein
LRAFSPPWSSSTAVRAFVDSASPGRNELDSFSCASVYLAGRPAALTPRKTSSQTSATIHLRRRPDARVRSFDMEPFRIEVPRK